MSNNNIVLFDTNKEIQTNGNFFGSIISKCKDSYNSIIFSDNISISAERGIEISQGLMVGFEIEEPNKKIAFSKKSDFAWKKPRDSTIEYSVLVPQDLMEKYDDGQLTDDFPFTINMLHTAGLLLNDNQYGINHLDFFKGEILNNPVSSIFNGVCIADRVVIDHNGDPVFYDCLIIGRDQRDDLSVSFEPIANVDDELMEYIIILGVESLKE